VPKVGFSVSEDLYKVLESVAKGRGISVHQLVKEIVELHALKLTSQVNLASLPENGTQVNLDKLTSENSKLTSQVNLTKLTSDSVRLTSANESQDQASDELVKRIEALEQRLDVLAKDVRKLQDLIIAYTGKSDQVLQRLSQVVEAFEGKRFTSC
jgi:EAL domain-containing protein (putative c-di-GMP-specific phosphodiesterase class I)